MTDVIADPTSLPPEYLTAALREGGALPEGEVRRIDVRSSSQTPASTITRLTVEYGPGAPAAAPARLFLKTPNPTRPADISYWVGHRETMFYRRVAPAMVGVPLVRCYSALVDASSRRWHVLMEDVGETHGPTTTQWPLPPPLDECEQLVDLLARLHAGWWRKGMPAPDSDDPPMPPRPSPEQQVAELRQRIAAFGDFLGERLSPRRRKTFAAVADGAPGMWRRRQEAGRPTTLIHGDAHAWNFLFPKDPGVGPVYLCDWQSWSIAEPTRDIAYLVGLHWFRDQRERFEQPLLRRYHARLRAEGVTDYPWEACWNDYRYSMSHLLWWPVRQWRNGHSAAVWWPHVERGMAAFDDLECAELLDQ
jgi:aminoglycoside phosphotransferase (APT) family kinase protein